MTISNWYTGDAAFDTVLAIGLIFAAFTILAGPFQQSPYGRFASDSFGVNMNPKLGWWLMEIPATVSFLFFFLMSDSANWQITTLFLGALWMVHYGNRGWFFPLSIRVAKGSKSSFSLMVMGMGMFVTAIHAYLNATWFTSLGKHLTPEWLSDPRFIIGLFIYAVGLFLILTSESVVRNLRNPNPAPDEPRYKIPEGYGYNFVSSPQYLGELLAWAGFATLTWGLPGVMIFLISFGNLTPRAFATHKWYKEKFENYPKNRKALIPFII